MEERIIRLLKSYKMVCIGLKNPESAVRLIVNSETDTNLNFIIKEIDDTLKEIEALNDKS